MAFVVNVSGETANVTWLAFPDERDFRLSAAALLDDCRLRPVNLRHHVGARIVALTGGLVSHVETAGKQMSLCKVVSNPSRAPLRREWSCLPPQRTAPRIALRRPQPNRQTWPRMPEKDRS
jgi:hypothetical protein